MKQDIICSGVPDAEMLGAAVGEFLRTVRPDRQRLYDYYRGEQPVNKGEAVRGRPNNLLRAPVSTLHHGDTHGIFSRHPPPALTYLNALPKMMTEAITLNVMGTLNSTLTLSKFPTVAR